MVFASAAVSFRCCAICRSSGSLSVSPFGFELEIGGQVWVVGVFLFGCVLPSEIRAAP